MIADLFAALASALRALHADASVGGDDALTVYVLCLAGVVILPLLVPALFHAARRLRREP